MNQLFIDYERLIDDYLRKRNANSRELETAEIEELRNKGFTNQRIYAVIHTLDDRTIYNNKYLLFYEGFKEEVEEKIKDDNETLKRYAEMSGFELLVSLDSIVYYNGKQNFYDDDFYFRAKQFLTAYEEAIRQMIDEGKDIDETELAEKNKDKIKVLLSNALLNAVSVSKREMRGL